MSKHDFFDWQAVGPAPIIGVDEVGRGCLAGAVYAAAVIIDPQKPYTHFTDSKTLSPGKRDKLAAEIRQNHQVGLGLATVEEIDRINILQASLLAMRRAVEALGVLNGHLIVDGTFRVPGMTGFQQTTLVKGDSRAHPVAAASIVAKVARDHDVARFEEVYPGYGFAKHKGYATQDHREAIARLGVTPEHRRSFAGVKEYCT